MGATEHSDLNRDLLRHKNSEETGINLDLQFVVEERGQGGFDPLGEWV